MRKQIATVFLLCVICAISISIAHSADGSVFGIVKAAGTLEPLAYVNVFLADTDLGCSSDRNGYFTLTGIAPGDYRLFATHIGFAAFKDSIKIRPGAKLFVEISLKQSAVAGDTVSVTGTRRYQSGLESDQIMLGESELNIAPRLGEPDLFRVIETFPGVTTVNDYNMGLYIRGGNADQNLILLDGMPIYNPFHLSGLFSTFDEEAIQWSTVSKSGIDPVYGNRLSSVIDINIRDGTAGEHAGYANVSFLSAKLRAEGPHPFGTYLFTIRRTYADKFVDLLHKWKILASDMKLPYYFVDGMGKIVIKPGDRQRLEITSYLGRDLYDMSVLDDNPGLGQYIWQNSATGMNYTAVLSPQLAFHLRGSFSRFEAQWLQPDTANSERIDNVFTGNTLNAFFKFDNPQIGQVKLGAEYCFHRYHLQTKGFTYQPLDFNEDESRENSIFADVYRPLGALLYVRGGIRMTHFSLQDTLTFSPQFSCGVKISPKQEIQLHWGRYHQDLITIGTEEVILSMFDAWVTVPQYFPVMACTQYALSYQCEIRRHLELNASVFHKYFSNLVEYNTTKFSTLDPDFVNGTGMASGLELSLRGVLGPFQGWLSYTLSQVRKEVNGVRYPPKYDKPHDLDLVVNCRLSKKWSMGGRFVLSSGTPFTKIIAYSHQPFLSATNVIGCNEFPIYSERNAWRLPVYHRLDINFIKRFCMFSRPMEFYIDVANVYARLNVLAYTRDRQTWIQMPPLATLGIRGKLW